MARFYDFLYQALVHVWLFWNVKIIIKGLISMDNLMLISTFFCAKTKAYCHSSVWVCWITPSGVFIDLRLFFFLNSFQVEGSLIGTMNFVGGILTLFSYLKCCTFHCFLNLLVHLNIFSFLFKIFISVKHFCLRDIINLIWLTFSCG
jgi:hypothetical protein